MKVYLLLGSNLGNRFDLLSHATKEIGTCIGYISLRSSLYETEPVGFVHENNFLNQVVIVETALKPYEVLRLCLDIEKRLGRTRSGAGYQARTIDIDMLYYEDLILNTDELSLPHPRMHLRLFALTPLNEVAPSVLHPIFLKNSFKLIQECVDRSRVIKL